MSFLTGLASILGGGGVGSILNPLEKFGSGVAKEVGSYKRNELALEGKRQQAEYQRQLLAQRAAMQKELEASRVAAEKQRRQLELESLRNTFEERLRQQQRLKELGYSKDDLIDFTPVATRGRNARKLTYRKPKVIDVLEEDELEEEEPLDEPPLELEEPQYDEPEAEPAPPPARRIRDNQTDSRSGYRGLRRTKAKRPPPSRGRRSLGSRNTLPLGDYLE